MPICRIIVATVMLLSAAMHAPAGAQATNVRFVLDFLLQGQQSAFVLGRERGYYTAQGVNLAAFDPGRGGADSITKVASGTHDIGFGDLSAMIEFNAKNPGRGSIAVLLIYDQAPLSLLSLKKSGIGKPADLMGRKGGAPAAAASSQCAASWAGASTRNPAIRHLVARSHVDPDHAAMLARRIRGNPDPLLQRVLVASGWQIDAIAFEVV